MTSHKKIVIWLAITAAMVFMMAVIGAITRLTGSGLSMAEWRPLIGFLPPLSETEWQRVYDLYRETPEFAHKNSWMDIAEFKKIFFWEWLHRLWGRLIGLVFAIPFIIFLIFKKIPHGFHLRFFILLLLGGSQGIIGWWMVKSGLIDRPDVSHFRLATHLGVAFIIYATIMWFIFDLRQQGYNYTLQLKANLSHICGVLSVVLLAVTICWGAFVAGLDAGLIFNAFPHMQITEGVISFTPDTAFSHGAIIHDHGWVQFTHRWLAILTGCIILTYAFIVRSYILAIMVCIQITLGILTLLTQVIIPLAALHQAGAFILLTILLYQLHKALHRQYIQI